MNTVIDIECRRPSNLIVHSDSADADADADAFKTPAAPKYPFFHNDHISITTSSECSPTDTCYGIFSEKHYIHMKKYDNEYKRIYYKKLDNYTELQVTQVIDYNFVKEKNISIVLWINEYKSIWDDAVYIGIVNNKTFLQK